MMPVFNDERLLDLASFRRHLEKLNAMIKNETLLECLEIEKEESLKKVGPVRRRFDGYYSTIIPHRDFYESSESVSMAQIMNRYDWKPDFWFEDGECVASVYILAKLNKKPPFGVSWHNRTDNRFEGVRVFYELNGKLIEP